MRKCFSSVQIYFPIFLVLISTVTAMEVNYLKMTGLQDYIFTASVFL